MSEAKQTIDAKLTYLSATKDLIKDALIEKGQAVSSSDTFRDYKDKILAISTGTDTSDANATVTDIKESKTAYVNGVKLVGTYVPIISDEDYAECLTLTETILA